MDRELKTAGLKNDPLAPPNFLTNSRQGALSIKTGVGLDDSLLGVIGGLAGQSLTRARLRGSKHILHNSLSHFFQARTSHL
ncbi:hypothetical protein FRC10_010228 [Ceratobasidium sp. 414]|nr:hypothetical protein FRC10_010228 [Ceratobasidium sp. 414]